MDGLLVYCLKNPSSVAGHHLAPRCLGLPGTAPVSEALRKGPVRQGAVDVWEGSAGCMGKAKALVKIQT